MPSPTDQRASDAASVSPSGERCPSPTNPARSLPLDGLRGLALLAVVAYHVVPERIPGGFLGVESFFVLSGFLLTGVLWREQVATGTIDRRGYAWRRVRRIAPALLALVTTLVVLGPVVVPDDAHRLVGDALSSLAGVTNWHLIADAASYFDQAGRPSFVRHLWSIAVEIQFYVLCPFLVAWLARRRLRFAVGALAAGVAVSAALMALTYAPLDPSRAYYGTDTRVGALLAGALLALVVSRPRGQGVARLVAGRADDPVVVDPVVDERVVWRRRWRSLVVLGSARTGTVGLVVLVGLFLMAEDRARWAYPMAFLATQAATAAVITASLNGGAPVRLLSARPLIWLGRRSYGIYLWHWPAVVLLRPGIDVSWSPLVAGAATVAFAVVAGSLSYTLIELPGLRWRPRRADFGHVMARRRSASRPVPAGGAALVVVTLAVGLLRLPSTDPLAQTLRAGEQALATQLASPDPPIAPTTPEASGGFEGRAETTDGPVASAAAAPGSSFADGFAGPAGPLSGVEVAAVGDSVMVSAAVALRDRLGPTGFIDAVNSRQFADGIDVARRLGESDGVDVVVVHLGNNGPVDHGDIDALLGELAGTRQVLLVNVRVSARWQDAVNATLADAAAHHPGVRLVDWYGRSEGHRDWFQSDGTHFRTISGPGAVAFADLIVASIAPRAVPVAPPAPTTASASPTSSPAVTTTTPPRPTTTWVPPVSTTKSSVPRTTTTTSKPTSTTTSPTRPRVDPSPGVGRTTTTSALR